jgi:hypothetical protein
MAELHLIGTLAQDPDGPERLAGLLDEVRPGAIGIEASRAAFEGQRERGDAAHAASVAAIQAKVADAAALAFWRRRLAKERLHYEAFTAAAYAEAHGLPLVFLDEGAPLEDTGAAAPAGTADDSQGGAEDPAAEFRFADGEALAALAAHDWEAAYAADYARARGDLEAKACLEFLLPLPQQPAYRARDRRMARQIAALLQGDGGPPDRPARPAGPGGPAGPPARGRRVAVVCALTHLYFSEARLTIYSQLYEATTRRYITDGAGLIHDHAIVLPWTTTGATSG